MILLQRNQIMSLLYSKSSKDSISLKSVPLHPISFIHATPATLASLLFPENTRHTPNSGPFHLPFLPEINVAYSFHFLGLYTKCNLSKCSHPLQSSVYPLPCLIFLQYHLSQLTFSPANSSLIISSFIFCFLYQRENSIKGKGFDQF